MAWRRTPKPYLASATPVAIAHRGFSRDGLENSLPAFIAAQDMGFKYLETDVNTTADGVTVVFHDASLDRVTDQGGLIAKLPYAVVREARIAGREPIATLAELVSALPHAKFNIDVKDAGSVVPLAETIELFGIHDRVCVASFSDKRRRAVLARLSKPVASAPGMNLMAIFVLFGPILPRPLLARLMRDVDVLQIPRRYRGIPVATARVVARAHSLGLKVHVWTINESTEMHELFDMGVDGVITDRADLLAAVMRERGYWT